MDGSRGAVWPGLHTPEWCVSIYRTASVSHNHKCVILNHFSHICDPTKPYLVKMVHHCCFSLNVEPSWFPVACSQIQMVVFQEYRRREWVRCFGAVLVSVRLGGGVTGYRGPALASLWQKWGFHARLVVNAVLLIWPASKGPGRSPEPTSTSSPTASPLAPPARLGSLPSFWASAHVWMQQYCRPPVRASSSLHPLPFNPLPSRLHSHSPTLWTCGSSFWSRSMIKIISPLPPFTPTFLFSFIWYVNCWPVSVLLFF